MINVSESETEREKEKEENGQKGTAVPKIDAHTVMRSMAGQVEEDRTTLKRNKELQTIADR